MKKVNVIWSNEAIKDLEVIYDFLGEKSIGAANTIIENLLSRTRQLQNFPKSGPKQKSLKGTTREHRYIIEGHYKIIYRIEDQILYIETIFDGRQNPDKIELL